MPIDGGVAKRFDGFVQDAQAVVVRHLCRCELLLKFRIPARMDFMSLLDRDLPSEKGGQSRHFNRLMLSSFPGEERENESRAISQAACRIRR
jgi:hypothetical protein